MSSDSVITAELLLDKRVTYAECEDSDGCMHPTADQRTTEHMEGGEETRSPRSQAEHHTGLGIRSGEGWPRNEGHLQEEAPGRGEEGALRGR